MQGINIKDKDSYIENLEFVIHCYENKCNRLENEIEALKKKNKELESKINRFAYIHKE